MTVKRIIPSFLRLLIFGLIGIGLLSYFAGSSTILYSHYCDDYVVFRAMGEGWLRGMIPYRDLFDHKGPLMYLIQMLALCINDGKVGIWLLELLFYVIYLELIYSIGRALKVTSVTNCVSIIASVVFLAAYVDNGNNVEGWSLPFITLPILLIVLYIQGQVKSIRITSLVSGMCFGCVALLRINNGCIIIGIALGILIFFIKERQYGTIIKSVIWFIFGAFLPIIPFMIYFWYNNALYDFVYCNYIFNVHYKAVWDGGINKINCIINAKSLFPCLLLTVLCLIRLRKSVQLALPICFCAIGIVTFLTFITGASYSHYFLIVAPVASLCILYASYFNKLWRMAVAILIIAPVFYWNHNLPMIAYDRIKRNSTTNQSAQRMEIPSIIPNEELDSIYVFGSFEMSYILMSNGHLPVGKYFFLQPKIRQVDRYVDADMGKQFESAHPKWILSSERIDKGNFTDISHLGYELVRDDKTKGHIVIYKRKSHN